jgi:hypothetical protein
VRVLRNRLRKAVEVQRGTQPAAWTDMNTRCFAALALALPLTLGCASSAGDEENTDQTDEALTGRRTVESISTISYAPNSFVIGNAYPGWHDEVQGAAQFSKGPGNEGGVSYRWGFILGEGFDHCAWLGAGALPGTQANGAGTHCGARQEIDTPHFLATYTNGTHNHLAGDGSLTHMQYNGSGCTDRNGYGNVDPWKVPAQPKSSTGAVPDGRALRWRYVSKDGHWVLVHDSTNNGSKTKPNWYFVRRGCVSLANAD